MTAPGLTSLTSFPITTTLNSTLQVCKALPRCGNTVDLAALAKCTAGAVKAAAQGGRARELHPYEVPCIIASEIVAIDAAYAAWLEAETT